MTILFETNYRCPRKSAALGEFYREPSGEETFQQTLPAQAVDCPTHFSTAC
jgi:hypothetical protein